MLSRSVRGAAGPAQATQQGPVTRRRCSRVVDRREDLYEASSPIQSAEPGRACNGRSTDSSNSSSYHSVVDNNDYVTRGALAPMVIVKKAFHLMQLCTAQRTVSSPFGSSSMAVSANCLHVGMNLQPPQLGSCVQCFRNSRWPEHRCVHIYCVYVHRCVHI